MKKFLLFIAAVVAFVGCCNCDKQEAPKFDKFNSVVYELNIRQATEEGTFAAADQWLHKTTEAD